jgi:hypothetical protein
MNQNAVTDFTLPKSSFSSGAGSCFNLSGNYYGYKTSRSAAQADTRAIRSDWEVTGRDVSGAIRRVSNEKH